jgi:predicted DNA-binding transcriptional regulator YafY
MAVAVVMMPLREGLRADDKPPVDAVVVLRQAIKEKRVVMFTYKGHARTVEPHALGKGTEDNPVLLAWQTDGGSQTEPPPGWRVFALTEIRELKPGVATFAKPRPDFGEHKVGRGLKSVEAEVAVE